jgi:hypothetical protein
VTFALANSLVLYPGRIIRRTLTLSGRGEQREARSVAACGSPPRRAATGPALYYDLQAIVDHSMI